MRDHAYVPVREFHNGRLDALRPEALSVRPDRLVVLGDQIGPSARPRPGRLGQGGANQGKPQLLQISGLM